MQEWLEPVKLEARAVPVLRSASGTSPLKDLPTEKTHRVVLQGVSWQTYQALLVDLGDHRASRLAFDRGILEITMPSDRHETNTKLLERMIETLTEELDLPIKGFRSTTLSREDLQRGAEPDSCYYAHPHFRRTLCTGFVAVLVL